MKKRLYVGASVLIAIIALVAVSVAKAAVAATPQHDYYPLTITVQEDTIVSGEYSHYLITVSNNSSTETISPLVYIDPTPQLHGATHHLIPAGVFGLKVDAWAVGKMLPHEVRQLEVSYLTMSTFTYVDENGVQQTQLLQLGPSYYEPTFIMYDAKYQRYSFASAAGGVTGGK